MGHTEETKRKISEKHKGKILTEDHKKKIGDAGRGKKRTIQAKTNISKGLLGCRNFLGKKHSADTIQKMRTARLKNNPMNNPDVVKKRSATLRERGTFKGEKSNNWKGGITKIGIKIRGSYEYKQWRISVFERDKWTCVKCKKKSKKGVKCKLNVHHKISFAALATKHNLKTMEDALKCKMLWDINNGETLCEDCHKLTPSFAKNTKYHADDNQ